MSKAEDGVPLRTQHCPLFYHDLCKGPHPPPPPHLAIAFNAGLWATLWSWEPTLQLISNAGCPLVVTSFCDHEAFLDEEVLQHIGGWYWQWQPALNPWRS